ncbi:MAG: glycosyltransferase family 39 protein, partial [Gallionellaceae bacterium]|nr:glycosyltransferase family 39 protein [Gallionellaceae bacterium]
MTSPPLSARSPIAHPLTWLLIWMVMQILARALGSPALELDEAQQIVWTQQLALGYGTQPPLYTWIQWGMNQVFGPSVWSLTILKVSLLALTYGFMWAAARELSLPPKPAWWAAASLMWMPQMGWESLRDLTHSVLLNCLVAATLWLLARQVQRPRPIGFVWLGIALGLGMMSKYSFALFAGALMVAALSVPAVRSALLSRGWWWLPLIAGLLLLPHALWLHEHWLEASQGTLEKLHGQTETGYGAGLFSLLKGIASNLLLWGIVVALVFGRGWRSSAISTQRAPANWARPLLVRYLALVLISLLLMIFVADASQFRTRWLHPLLCVVPLLAFVWRPEWENHPRGRGFTWGPVVLAVVRWAAAA